MVCLEELYLFKSEWCGLFYYYFYFLFILFFYFIFLFFFYFGYTKIFLKATSFMETEGIS